MINSKDLPSLLTPVIYHHVQLGQNQVPSMRKMLFNIQTSKLAEEKGTGLGGISPDSWNHYQSNGSKGRLAYDEQYTQTYTHLEYPVQMVLRKRLLLNDQYGEAQKYSQKAGVSAEQKMEIDAASLLNNAFSTSYLFGDGKPLSSATHPRGPHNSGNTYSNRGTSALTADTVSATRILMMRIKDDKGNEIGIMPDELWVPPELADQAEKIVGSAQEPGTANNDKNPQQGRFKVVPWLRLSDTNNWFMASSTWRQQVVNWYEREQLQVMIVHEDTTDIVVEFKLHYSFGVDDWRWVYGHEVT